MIQSLKLLPRGLQDSLAEMKLIEKDCACPAYFNEPVSNKGPILPIIYPCEKSDMQSGHPLHSYTRPITFQEFNVFSDLVLVLHTSFGKQLCLKVTKQTIYMYICVYIFN